jgi:hypothetical protein
MLGTTNAARRPRIRTKQQGETVLTCPLSNQDAMKQIVTKIEELISMIGAIEDDSLDRELAMIQRMLAVIVDYVEDKTK